MEPFSPQDPMYRLLGKSRVVEPRPNFTQNVVRAVRQIGQTPAFWERLEAWLGRVWRPAALCGGAAAVVMLALAFSGSWRNTQTGVAGQIATARISAPSATFVEEPSSGAPTENDVASELEGMNQLGVLLAQRDASSLSDSEIGALLY